MRFYIAAALVLLIDQSSKLLVRAAQIPYSTNTGTVFGLLKGNNMLFILVTVTVILALLYYQFQTEEPANSVAVGLIFGGAFGNLIDRIFLGGVIDFIDMKIWPSFNLSDAALMLGVGLLVIKNYKK